MIISDMQTSYLKGTAKSVISRNGSGVQFNYTEDGVNKIFWVDEESLREFLNEVYDDSDYESIGTVITKIPLDKQTILYDLSKRTSFRELIGLNDLEKEIYTFFHLE